MSVDPSHDERVENGLIDPSRRKRAMDMRLSGMSFQQIGDHLGMTKQGAWEMIGRALASEPSRQANEMRLEENLKLDRMESRLAAKVLDGDLRAILANLKIMERRARMNGLDLAADVSVSVSVRQDLDVALKQLEEVIKGEVIDRPAE